MGSSGLALGDILRVTGTTKDLDIALHNAERGLPLPVGILVRVHPRLALNINKRSVPPCLSAYVLN
jgi:hypothetical protein